MSEKRDEGVSLRIENSILEGSGKSGAKIAYVHTGLWPSNSPSMTFSTMTTAAFASIGIHCLFFIKKNSNMSPDQVFLDTFHSQKPDLLTIRPISRFPYLKWNRLHYKRVYRILKKEIKCGSLTAVISRNTTFLPYLAELSQRYGIKTFFEAHDFYADLTVRDDVNLQGKKRYSRIEKKYIPLVSGVICLQKNKENWYQRTFPRQTVFVARTGIEKIHRYPFHNRSSIAYIGSFDAHKGLDTLLEALKYTHRKPHLFIIGGKNDIEIEAIRKLIPALYDQSKVTLTGWLNKDQLGEHLRRTALGILPLKDSFFNRYITSPLKLFDYYSHGIPVLASDLPTTRELIHENVTGLFFQSKNSKDLAQKIDYLLSNRKMMETMSKHVYTRAQKYLWIHRAQHIWNAIENIT